MGHTFKQKKQWWCETHLLSKLSKLMTPRTCSLPTQKTIICGKMTFHSKDPHCTETWNNFSINKCFLCVQRACTAAAAMALQACLTLCDPMENSPPGSPVPGILQARTPEWVAISFPNAWKWKVKVKFLSRVLLLATRWTAAYQAPPSMGFSRQECWSGVPLPSPPALAGGFFTTAPPGKPP